MNGQKIYWLKIYVDIMAGGGDFWPIGSKYRNTDEKICQAQRGMSRIIKLIK